MTSLSVEAFGKIVDSCLEQWNNHEKFRHSILSLKRPLPLILQVMAAAVTKARERGEAELSNKDLFSQINKWRDFLVRYPATLTPIHQFVRAALEEVVKELGFPDAKTCVDVLLEQRLAANTIDDLNVPRAATLTVAGAKAAPGAA